MIPNLELEGYAYECVQIEVPCVKQEDEPKFVTVVSHHISNMCTPIG